MHRKKKVFTKNDKLRVRKSYYTFSREYPQGFVRIERSKKSINKKQVRKATLYTVCFLVLACLSYFAVSLMLGISYKEVDDTQQSPASYSEYDTLLQQGIKALYVPVSRLGDDSYIKDVTKQVKRRNCNSVVIDFKTNEGKLAYSSLQENAIGAKSALYDNDTVRQALTIFSNEHIAVVAKLYCFEDPAVSNTNPDLAVKYMDTDVNWLDGGDDNGGKAWLNPYSKRVRNYLCAIAKEINAFGINAFILESLQFPGGENISGATYPGEKNESNRNAALKSVINSIKDSLPENAIILFSQSAGDAVSGNDSIYYGSMSDISTYGVAVDTRDRPISISVDKKTGFVSVLSMYSSIAAQYPNKTIVPIIDMTEYSYSYIRSMKKSGYTSFILYSEQGDY